MLHVQHLLCLRRAERLVFIELSEQSLAIFCVVISPFQLVQLVW